MFPPSVSSSSELLDEYNILVLGEAQSGKSTLIQHMRKYADPEVAINANALGTGALSHTMEVKTTTITTDFPEYYVTDKSGNKVNYGECMELGDEHDYEEFLNMRRGLETKKGDARLMKKVKVNLIDTPGLNATGGDDEAHVQKIFNGLIEVKTAHLLVITISSGPFTQGLQDAIRGYVDMFPNFNGIIAFVDAHFDYKNFHPGHTQVSHAIDLRMSRLQTLFGCRTSRRTSRNFTHFKIDCDVYNKKPIRDCVTQNTIQKILELATFNQPIDMLQTVVHKTRKMRDIDKILRSKFEETSAILERALRCKDAQEGKLLAEIFRNEATVHKLDAQIKVVTESLIRHEVDLLEILNEERRDMDYEIAVLKETGSHKDRDSWKSWRGAFRRTSPQYSVLHVNVCTTMSNIQAAIKMRNSELMKLKEERKVATRIWDDHTQQYESRKQKIKEIVNNHSEGIQILRIMSNDVLTLDVFNVLMEAKAYIGDTVSCAKQVQAVYTRLAKRDGATSSAS